MKYFQKVTKYNEVDVLVYMSSIVTKLSVIYCFKNNKSQDIKCRVFNDLPICKEIN